MISFSFCTFCFKANYLKTYIFCGFSNSSTYIEKKSWNKFISTRHGTGYVYFTLEFTTLIDRSNMKCGPI